jgi:glycosyltransferase involved in cell wall biosynthesis
MVPEVSVIICCYNSVRRLPVTIQHLFNQKDTGSINWEVIIVDNASTDGTYEFAINLLSKGQINFQVVKELNPGQAAARLKGYQVSKYEYLLYCDDDNHLGDNYVSLAYNVIRANPKIGILGGNGRAVFEGTEPAWFQKYSRNFAVGEQSSSIEDFTKVAEVYGAGSVMRKSFLNALFNSGFKTVLVGRTATQLTSGDDVELCYMAKHFGYEIWYHRGLKFDHLMSEGRMSWNYLKNLYRGFGRTNIYTQAYLYVERYHKVPGENLSLPFWLDAFIHKVRYIFNYYPKVMWKMNREGDEEVLRFIAMKAEAQEIWRLKGKYIELYKSIYSYLNSLNGQSK